MSRKTTIEGRFCAVMNSVLGHSVRYEPKSTLVQQYFAIVRHENRISSGLGRVESMLDVFDGMRANLIEHRKVELAIFFSVIDRARHPQDVLSGIEFLGTFFPKKADTLERVTRLVNATKRFPRLDLGGDEAFIADIDLAFLGADDPAEVISYWEGARAERTDLSEEEFNLETGGAIRTLLGYAREGTLYRTSYFRARRNETAKENLETCLDRLSLAA